MIRKELRSLLPLALLVVLFMGADLVYKPMTSSLDEASWTEMFGGDVEPGRGQGHAIVLGILALLVSYSLFPREHDDGTIHFLHSLPISRSRIFGAKLAAALLVVWFGVGIEHTLAWWFPSHNPQSFSGSQFDLRTALGVAFLHAAFAAFMVAHGVLISFFRKFGFVVLGVAIWLFVGLKRVAPSTEFLDPAGLLALEYEGRRLLMPWGDLAVHAAAAGGSLAAAWALWSGPAERVSAAYSRATALPWGKVALGCGTLLLICLGLSLITWFSRQSGPPPEPVRYVSFETASAETEHYRFTYPVNLRRKAVRLIERSGEVHRELREVLGASDGDAVVVDLGEQSAEHAGIARWQKIRMGLVGSDDADELLRTFAHEASHTFQYRESNRRIAEQGNAADFFLEGSAEWLSFRVVPGSERLVAGRRVAAASWRRQRIEFEVLADRARLRERHDTNLVYALGETWTAALVAAHGEDAVGRVLRAVGRRDAPRGLEAIPFWQDSLQAAGCDLERVLGAWKRLLEEIEHEQRAALDALPRIGGGIDRVESGEIVFAAVLDRPPAHPEDRVWLRLRDRVSAKDEETEHFAGVTGDTPLHWEIGVPRGSVRGRRCQFQLGIDAGPHALPYWEEWQEAEVPR